MLELSLDDEARSAALETLCESYWYPLYAHVRQRGRTSEEAEDLTQDFFAHFLAKDGFMRFDTDRGRLRTFLLASVDRFLTGEYRKSMAQKRGSGVRPLSIDIDAAEERLVADTTEGMNPEKVFAQRWAETVLSQVQTALEQEYTSRDKVEQYHATKAYLFGQPGEAPYRDVAEQLGMSEPGVRQAVLRMRKRYGLLLRTHVSATVENDSEVEQEIRELFAAFQPG